MSQDPGTEVRSAAAELASVGEGLPEAVEPGCAMPRMSDVPQRPRHLETVMQIPVSVKIVLGSATMPVANVLKLGRGAVVPLDRKVGEPVDVVVNGRVVARGEVVVLDEDSSRFGVSLTEVIGSSAPQAGCLTAGWPSRQGRRAPALAISRRPVKRPELSSMAETYDKESKTEEPTEKKIRDSLEKGRVPLLQGGRGAGLDHRHPGRDIFLFAGNVVRLKFSLETFIDNPGEFRLESSADAVGRHACGDSRRRR